VQGALGFSLSSPLSLLLRHLASDGTAMRPKRRHNSYVAVIIDVDLSRDVNWDLEVLDGLGRHHDAGGERLEHLCQQRRARNQRCRRRREPEEPPEALLGRASIVIRWCSLSLSSIR
jgi:hypothetical protein